MPSFNEQFFCLIVVNYHSYNEQYWFVPGRLDNQFRLCVQLRKTSNIKRYNIKARKCSNNIKTICSFLYFQFQINLLSIQFSNKFEAEKIARFRDISKNIWQLSEKTGFVFFENNHIDPICFEVKNKKCNHNIFTETMDKQQN